MCTRRARYGPREASSVARVEVCWWPILWHFCNEHQWTKISFRKLNIPELIPGKTRKLASLDVEWFHYPMSFGEVFRTQTKRGPRVLTLSHFKTIEISFQCVSGWWWLEPWNGLWLSRNSWEWNVIPTDDSSIIFQRGWRSTTNWSTSWSWWRWSQWDHSDPWTLLTNRIGRLILKKMLLNIYWPGNKFYFLLFFCRVSKIGNGF